MRGGSALREIIAQAHLDKSDEEIRAEIMRELPIGALCPEEPETCAGQASVGRLLDCPWLDECPHRERRERYRHRCGLEVMGFGRTFWEVTWDHIPEDVAGPLLLYRDSIEQRLRDGDGWGLSGPVGAGKTSALALTGRAAQQIGADVQYCSTAEMLAKIHGGESPRYWAHSDLLLLDDLGAEYVDRRHYNVSQLQHVVDLRWEKGLSICFTTNLTRDDVKGISELARTFDRLCHRCAWLATQRESQRRRATVEDWLPDD